MTELAWFFGPDRHPFRLDPAGAARGRGGDPFHGIVGRGMLELLEQQRADPRLWLRHAHRLFDPGPDPGEDAAAWAELVAMAQRSGTLSFGESAECVRLYLEDHCPEARSSPDTIEAWNVKEGHTSSVWKVSIPGSRGDATVFAVNVGRDRVAAAELRTTSEQMRRLARLCPDLDIAAVLDIRTVWSPLGNETVVTRNEWVFNAREIHVPRIRAGQQPGYVLVERFLTGDTLPAGVASIRGRPCNAAERQRIDTAIARFADRAAAALPDPPKLELNDGDVVWNGHVAVVVATS